jgi:glycosyltransferase involved in cell wall biosynthesis
MKPTIRKEGRTALFKLSILIPTVVGREEKLERLLSILNSQGEFPSVEILIEKDNKEISIGSKRQELLEKAKGEYVSFIDDDDEVSDDYISQILKAIEYNHDAIGFKIECTFNGTGKCMASASKRYADWGENQDGFRYVRSIYHKTPVRRELALKAGFEDMRFGEDYVYSRKIMSLVKSEYYIDKVLYFYKYNDEEGHDKKYGIK